MAAEPHGEAAQYGIPFTDVELPDATNAASLDPIEQERESLHQRIASSLAHLVFDKLLVVRTARGRRNAYK